MKTKILFITGVLFGLWLFSACETVNLDNPDVCSSDTDCSGGEICKDGVCTALCSDDSECDFYCNKVSGTCSKCLINSQCPNGFVCNIGKGVCLSFCGSDNDCAEGKICLNGACQTAQCTAEADCKGTQPKCLDGRCVEEKVVSYPEQVPCKPGVLQCWDNKVVSCSADGMGWDYSHICKEGDTCNAGRCRSDSSDVAAYVCQPYSVKCAAERRIQICRPDGSQYVDWTSCSGDGVCINGDCVTYTPDSEDDSAEPSAE